MALIPESIDGSNTRALEGSFRQRIINMCPEQLRIDIENERDLVKLGLWLEQFGIPVELLPDDLEQFAFRELLQKVLKIYRLSGTDVSIRLLAQALQAETAGVARGCFQACYNGQGKYEGLSKHDGGRGFEAFAVDVHISGLGESRREEFETTFRKLFQVFEPVGIFLRDVNFEGIFDTTFYSDFN